MLRNNVLHKIHAFKREFNLFIQCYSIRVKFSIIFFLYVQYETQIIIKPVYTYVGF